MRRTSYGSLLPVRNIRRLGLRLTAVASMGALAVGTLAGAPAMAGTASTATSAALAKVADTSAFAQSTVVSDNPVDYTPQVLDGTVFAIAQVGNEIVLGGEFTRVRAAAEGSPELTRKNLLAYDKTTGAISETFAPVANDVVRSLAAAPDGTSVYVGGKFGAIDGVPAYKLARLDVATGAPVPGFNPKRIDAAVMDVQLSGDRLFIAGLFTSVQNVPHRGLAELDPTTGAVRDTTNIAMAGVMWGGTTQGFKTAVTPDGTRMVLIGNFATINGLARPQVAMLDLTTNPVSLLDWVAPQWAVKCGSSSSTKFDVRDVRFAPDGTYFVIGASGGHTPVGGLCDGTTRWETAATGSAKPTWFAMTGGDSVYAVEPTGAVVYAGGHFRWFNNPVYVQSYQGPGAVKRKGIAALDPMTGIPLRWNPERDRGLAVWDFLATDDGLYVAHDTDRIGHYEYHARNALFPLAGGTAVPQPPTPVLPGDVQLVNPPGAPDQIVTLPGFAGSTTGSATINAGAGVGWTSTRGAFLADGAVYAVTTNRTLVRYPVAGSTYGAPTTVNLNGLTTFANQLPSVTSMFYTDGRLFYTLANQNALYMRFFTVESDIVGATEYTVVGGIDGVDWRSVRGAFLASGALYWADSATGVLSQVTWTGYAPVGGTSVPVSGPAIDGTDWRSNALFVTGVTVASSIAYVDTAANTDQATAQTRSVTLPAGTSVGDVMVLFWSSNATAPDASAPAGWTSIGSASALASTTSVWTKVATAEDLGTTVAVSTAAFLKADLVLAAYSGTAGATGVVAAESATTSTHLSPTIDVPTAGSWVVSYWADKSASTTAWTPPAGVMARFTAAGTGSGHVSELFADSGASVPTGIQGGLPAVASSASRNAGMVTVVLAPL